MLPFIAQTAVGSHTYTNAFTRCLKGCAHHLTNDPAQAVGFIINTLTGAVGFLTELIRCPTDVVGCPLAAFIDLANKVVESLAEGLWNRACWLVALEFFLELVNLLASLQDF